MTVQSAKIGLDQLHYALLTADTALALTYGTVTALPAAIEAKITAANTETVLYADNALSEVAYALGKVTLELNVKDIDLETQAALLGHSIALGVMVVNVNDVAPYVAVGFRSLKANGKYRYTWLLKGKFGEIDDNSKTRGETTEFQTATLKGVFGGTIHTGDVIRKSDEDATGYTSAVATAWWTSPVIET